MLGAGWSPAERGADPILNEDKKSGVAEFFGPGSRPLEGCSRNGLQHIEGHAIRVAVGCPLGLELPLLTRCCTRVAGVPREAALEVNGAAAAALSGVRASGEAQ